MRAFCYMVFVLLTLSAALAFAQDTGTGTISGKIVDDENQPIAGATVEVVNTQINATTNAAGEFTLSGVPAGPQTLRASTYSYRAQTAEVTVAAGQTLSQDFTLRL